jgi:hypothetical protein
LRRDLGYCPAKDGEVLGVDKNNSAVYLTGAGNYGITQVLLLSQSEVGGAVGDEGVQLFKAAFVEEEVEPLSGG